jgi:integrase
MAAGVRQRHGRACTAKSRCGCPYEAFVYSKRDGKKIRRTFASKAAVVAWRNDASTAVRKKIMRAPTSITLEQAAQAWLVGASQGLIRTRSGDPYKPGALRSYEKALRLRVLPELGSVRLTEVARNDLQDIVDNLLAEGLNASTVAGTMLPVRAIYRRALSRGEVAINPTTGLEMPAARGGRDRIASPDECANLLEALPRRDRALWASAMYGGLRRGELMALRIEDVDLGAGLIHVRRGWDVVEGEIATKSGKGPPGADRRGAARLRRRAAARARLAGGARVRGYGDESVHPLADGQAGAEGMGGGETRTDNSARVPPHLRLADDRRRGQR